MDIDFNDALLVIDMQNDFCPGGSLPVNGGDQLLPYINRAIIEFAKSNALVIFSRDWHPQQHISFNDKGGPWPQHCVQNTKGAAFHHNLFFPDEVIIISKGTNINIDAYSAFEGTKLLNLLHRLKIKRITACGLALEFCVKASIMDAIHYGFVTRLLCNSTLPVELNDGDGIQALQHMRSSGVELIMDDNSF